VAGALVLLELNGIPLRTEADRLEAATLQPVQGKLEGEPLADVFQGLVP